MYKGNKILCVIAARGGSKGLPNKNIKALGGKPLIAYTIQQARRWGKATDIVCSTDSEKIAKIAKRYGAETPFLRSRDLAGDGVPKLEVIRDALFRCENIYKRVYDIIVDLDITAPIRKVSDLDNCLRLFRKKRPKTLFSVVRSRKNPYFNMVEEKKNGKVALCKTIRKPVFARQAAPLVYDMNASIYFYRRDYLADNKNSAVISDNSIVYVMDEISDTDIDSKTDFEYIEFLIKEGMWKSEV